MRYINGSKSIGIVWKGRKVDKKKHLLAIAIQILPQIWTQGSQTGYNFTLYGAAVSWKSTLIEAVKERKWLIGVIGDFEVKQKVVKVLYDNNNSAICLAKNQVFHERSKHITISFISLEMK